MFFLWEEGIRAEGRSVCSGGSFLGVMVLAEFGLVVFVLLPGLKTMKKEIQIIVAPEVAADPKALRRWVAQKLKESESKLTHVEILRQ